MPKKKQTTTIAYEPAPDKEETVAQLLSRIKRNTLTRSSITTASIGNSDPEAMFRHNIRHIDSDKHYETAILHLKCVSAFADRLAATTHEVLDRRELCTVAGTRCVQCNEIQFPKELAKKLKDSKERYDKKMKAYKAYRREQFLLGKV